MAERKTLKGICYLCFAPDNDGIYWAFQDEKFITNRGKTNEQWSYNGLHPLKDGDHLTIYDPENKGKIIWSGKIYFIWEEKWKGGRHFTFGKSRAVPKGVKEEDWKKWFVKEYPAKLITTDKK